MSSNHPSLKEKSVKLLKEVDEVSGLCGLLKPAAHPEPATNKSSRLQSVYWLLCKAWSEKSTTARWVKII
jgi:hypothetical protein